eukprot:COSAG01_NODE_332_length_18712_cov_41.424358_18_plen_175_part_00
MHSQAAAALTFSCLHRIMAAAAELRCTAGLCTAVIPVLHGRQIRRGPRRSSAHLAQQQNLPSPPGPHNTHIMATNLVLSLLAAVVATAAGQTSSCIHSGLCTDANVAQFPNLVDAAMAASACPDGDDACGSNAMAAFATPAYAGCLTCLSTAGAAAEPMSPQFSCNVQRCMPQT